MFHSIQGMATLLASLNWPILYYCVIFYFLLNFQIRKWKAKNWETKANQPLLIILVWIKNRAKLLGNPFKEEKKKKKSK